jgi:phospholipid transport system substrate-binding protein
MNLKALKPQYSWMMLVTLLMAAASSLSQATLADPGMDDPTIHSDPQPLLMHKINKLVDRLSDSAEKIRSDQSVAYQISDELIAPHIDFPRITRLVIGKYWNTASDAQRQQLVEEIKALLIRSYVTAMTSYVDEIIEHQKRTTFQPSRYKDGDTKASVRASIPLSGGQTADVQYQLYYKDAWKIYDIRIEGISLAITYRTSFGEQIKRDGLDNLIAQLAERNRKGEVELPESIGPASETKPR